MFYACQYVIRFFPAQNDFLESRSWELQFVGNLQSTYFTAAELEQKIVNTWELSSLTLWIRSRKFRLGARIVQSSAQGFQVREASSGAFTVKDHHGNFNLSLSAYKKHYPPALDDEIWHVEGIAKDGSSHSKLESSGIRTVQDFLQFWSIDLISLRRIFDGNTSDRKWEKIVGHAKTCELNDQFFMYKASQTDAVIFNYIYKVVGAMCDGQILHFDELSMSQKRMVEDLKWKAYNKRTELLPFEPEYLMPLSNLEALPRTGELLGLLPLGFRFSYQDQIDTQLSINSPTNSNFYDCDFEVPQLEETNGPQLHGFPHLQVFTATAGISSILVDSFSGFPNNEEFR
ncbi:Calmodulin binding protein, C-terminal domain [Dillenia turbinata]|uniref:Calmodulin binding protein, C-terminal domain n=1 Tax=Dillenia turbinata TaxID=194707 RepID=A0AAN8YYG5_9MAGN